MLFCLTVINDGKWGTICVLPHPCPVRNKSVDDDNQDPPDEFKMDLKSTVIT